MTLGPVIHPEIISRQLEENMAQIQIRIPEDLAYFDGHFAGMPVVPGVVQLHWAVQYAKSIFKLDGFVTLGSQIKFSNLMQPKDEVCLTLDYNPEKSALSFNYKSNEKAYSSGRLTFANNEKVSH